MIARGPNFPLERALNPAQPQSGPLTLWRTFKGQKSSKKKEVHQREKIKSATALFINYTQVQLLDIFKTLHPCRNSCRSLLVLAVSALRVAAAFLSFRVGNVARGSGNNGIQTLRQLSRPSTVGDLNDRRWQDSTPSLCPVIACTSWSLNSASFRVVTTVTRTKWLVQSLGQVSANG